jgi:hypothetical protein
MFIIISELFTGLSKKIDHEVLVGGYFIKVRNYQVGIQITENPIKKRVG